jgi:hypothetical protein
MKPNVGPKERYVRIGLGILSGVAALTLAKSRKSSLLLGMAAASGIETGLSRYCPGNTLLGIDNAPNVQETPLHPLL